MKATSKDSTYIPAGYPYPAVLVSSVEAISTSLSPSRGGRALGE